MACRRLITFECSGFDISIHFQLRCTESKEIEIVVATAKKTGIAAFTFQAVETMRSSVVQGVHSSDLNVRRRDPVNFRREEYVPIPRSQGQRGSRASIATTVFISFHSGGR